MAAKRKTDEPAPSGLYEYRRVAIGEIAPYERNPRTHSPHQIEQLRASIREFGFTNPLLIDPDGQVIAGHGRMLAAKAEGMAEVPAIVVTGLSEDQRKALVIADNQLALGAGWDEALLADELRALQAADYDISLIGFSDDELKQLLASGDEDPYADGVAGGMADKFIVPPFSVLDTRAGYWQERKARWLAMGLRSNEGRAQNLISYNGVSTSDEFDTSVFDPVLCELVYRWFSPPGGVTLDPFAGGSVRGVVGAKLGRRYVGIDLRKEQVEANREQAGDLLSESEPAPVWHCGDSRNIRALAAGLEADFVMTCPPYADLEVYSEDPRDLSTMKYADFVSAYREIIAGACSLLKRDRFACIVVGEVRNKAGGYVNFVGDTIQAFLDAGLTYYNEAILVTAVGSLPLRAGKAFSSSRKFGKCHQNVLVFVKGDPKRATEACGEIEIDLPPDADAQEAG